MDPAKMKVVDLRSELGALGLDTKGNKPALVERLKKALEAKTGKVLPDTSILDTTTEGDDDGTPRRPGPAARTRRRSSSTRITATPAKQSRRDSPECIEEESKDEGEDRYSPQPDSDSNSMSEPASQAQAPVKEESAAKENSPPKEEKTPEKNSGSEPYTIDDDRSQSPVAEKNAENEDQDESKDASEKKDESKNDEPVVKIEVEDEKQPADKRRQSREMTEEEEWEELNERLKIKEQERIEREKQQAEEDAKKLESLSSDPVKLNRLKRKLEKKARWNNFYRAVEVTNEVLTPPAEEDYKITKGKKEVVETKLIEPEIDEYKIALSWFDSDLNLYLEEDLSGAVPLGEGAFAHAWAGVRATHGVTSGRVCYEVRVGSAITTTENTEKEVVASGLRLGWSTDDASLHLGDGEQSWGYESTGRAVNNGEFKEYGKQLNERDVVGIYLDLESKPCKIFYTLNGTELGTAFEFDKSSLGGKALFPHILTKNQFYRVNFGYDKYNMITKTKIVRNRIEIPVEQVLEEKRAKEAELQQQKEEKERKEKERKEREKQEREERNKKRKEEREKQEKEKKEKEAQEKRDKGEVVEEEKEKDAEKEKETPATDKPQENGEKPEEEKEVVEVKTEPMETDAQPPQPVEAPADVKEDPDGDVVEVTEEQVLQGHVLDKRIQFVIRYTVDEELDGTEACLVPGYVLISLANLVPGPRAPASVAEAEVILMVGMPGSGKTHWAKQHCAANPQRRYNIISTGALFDKMKVDCKPFKATYEGRWDAFVSKCAKCVLKLLEMARGRKRNFILDQTNVYPSAQRRKLRDFDGYRRIAVVIVTDEETYKERFKKREEADGKEVPDPAILDMKANFTPPEKCTYIDEVLYPELSEEEAKVVIEAFHKEAKAAGVTKEKERRDRSAGRDQPPNKRARDDKRHGRDSRDRSRDFRDREDRWSGGGGGGGGGGGRWIGGGGGGGGGGGRGGSRWGGGGGGGGRDMGRPNQGPPGRFDRWGPPPPPRGGDFGNRDRDNFRGGRGGGPGGPPRGDRGPVGRGPGGPPGGDRSLFSRDNRGPRGMPPGDKDKRPAQGPPGGGFGGPQGGGGGGGGGGAGQGSWQRGGASSGGAGPIAQNTRGGRSGPPSTNQPRPPAGPPANKDGQQNQGQQNQQSWNQWAGGWGGWNNWNQNQAGWNNWGNWGNWGGQGQQNASGGSQQQGAGGKTGQNQQQQQQWPGNYTAQQWYQWQQWQQQQQQQGWPGYGQGQGQTPTAQEAQQAWAQYYQNYGAGAGGNAAGAITGGEKK